MTLMAPGGFEREEASAGLHNAVFCEVYDIGAQPLPTDYREADRPGYRRQVIVVFQTEERQKDGRRREILQYVGLSTGNNSTLHKWFKSWIGTDYKARYGVGGAVDIERAMNENPNCVLMVAHSDKGRAKIESVAKSTVALKPENYSPLADRGDYFKELQTEGFAAVNAGLHKKVPTTSDLYPEFVAQ